jgi:hypothetical protein
MSAVGLLALFMGFIRFEVVFKNYQSEILMSSGVFKNA